MAAKPKTDMGAMAAKLRLDRTCAYSSKANPLVHPPRRHWVTVGKIADEKEAVEHSVFCDSGAPLGDIPDVVLKGDDQTILISPQSRGTFW